MSLKRRYEVKHLLAAFTAAIACFHRDASLCNPTAAFFDARFLVASSLMACQ
jgi:hypothetical protein